MTGNKDKVDRYYAQFKQADEDFNRFLDEIGEILYEEGRAESLEWFQDQLEALTAVRENARLRFETVCREEAVGAGDTRVQTSIKRDYDGNYLWRALEQHPHVRDKVVTLEYKVDKSKLPSLVEKGYLDEETLNSAVSGTKEVVSVLNLPKKVGW